MKKLIILSLLLLAACSTADLETGLDSSDAQRTTAQDMQEVEMSFQELEESESEGTGEDLNEYEDFGE